MVPNSTPPTDYIPGKYASVVHNLIPLCPGVSPRCIDTDDPSYTLVRHYHPALPNLYLTNSLHFQLFSAYIGKVGAITLTYLFLRLFNLLRVHLSLVSKLPWPFYFR